MSGAHNLPVGQSDWARRDAIPSRKVGLRPLYLRPSTETPLLEERF